MVITAVFDRVEDDSVILISNETGMEIAVPLRFMDGAYETGETVSVTIEEKVV